MIVETSGLVLIRITAVVSPDQHFLKQLSFTWFSINHVLVSNLIIRWSLEERLFLSGGMIFISPQLILLRRVIGDPVSTGNILKSYRQDILKVMFMERSYNFINVWYTTLRDNVLCTAFSERPHDIICTWWTLRENVLRILNKYSIFWIKLKLVECCKKCFRNF